MSEDMKEQNTAPSKRPRTSIPLRKRLWLRVFYRRWSRLIHRYGYHHTRTLYPADENGVHPTAYCDWCGLRSKLSNFDYLT